MSEVSRRTATTGDNRTAVYDAAFRASLDPAALETFEQYLAKIGAIADAAGPNGTMALLRHARGVEDLTRMLLLATTNADRAIAVAKHAPADGAVPESGRGRLRFTPELTIALATIVCSGLGVAFAAIATAMEALARVLSALNIIQRHAETPLRPRRGHTLLRDLKGPVSR